MTQGRLKKAGIQDVDSMRSQVQMKMLEAPISHGFLSDDVTLRPICRKESTVNQEHQLDSYSKQEPDVKILWHDKKMVASRDTTSTILVRQSRSPE